MNRDKLRAGIYGMAAIYMIYIAMQIYKEGGSGIAIAFFALAAIGLLVFAFVIAKRITEEEKKRAKEEHENESET